MAEARHQVEPDGYCPSCGTVGCRQRDSPATGAGRAVAGQLDRIEALLRRIARRVGVEVEGDEG